MWTLLLSAVLAQTDPAAGGEVPRLDSQLFRPSPSAVRTWWTHDATRLPDRYWTTALTLHYARDPFVWVGEQGTVTAVVSDVVAGSLTGGAQLGPLWMGAEVPLLLRSGGVLGGETGLGDVGVQAKATALDHDDAPLGLAVLGSVIAPTSTVQTALGRGGFGYELEAIVDRPVGPALLAFNVGLHGLPDRGLENLTWGDRLVARLGAGTPVGDRAEASLELVGSTNLAGLDGSAGVPVELLAGGGYRLVDDVELAVGAGTGLTGGIGAPVARVMAAVRYAPPLVRDRDDDGVPDTIDACRSEPEDRDGVDDGDGCPEPTQVTVRIEGPEGRLVGDATFTLEGGDEGPVEGHSGDVVERFGGRYELTAAAPGHAAATAVVTVRDGPDHPVVLTLEQVVVPGTLEVTIADGEGAPVVDARWWLVDSPDEVFGTGDRAKLPPGAHEVRVEAPGFRPQTVAFELEEGGEQAVAVVLDKALVELTSERLVIKDSIYFETGKAVIRPDSHSLLEEVAQTLREHPEVRKVRIEGHTDARGDAAMNLRLSTDRAGSVVDFLVDRGVERDRLDPVGFGETKPLEQGTGEAVWSVNRRVDFFIVDLADSP
jgi:outer membrane protein OmpA-like peptidoglycan-associated protein